MARGDTKTFYDYPLKAGKKLYDNVNDVFKFALITDTYASVDVNVTDPVLTTYTECAAGGNYTAGGNTLTGQTWTRSGAITKQDFADYSLLKHASNPTTAKCLLYINSTAANNAYYVVDLTADGTTAVDLVNNDLNITINANGTINATVTA